jgi:hypothetical protein
MHITVDDELLARIDEVKHEDQSRAAFVRRALERAVTGSVSPQKWTDDSLAEVPYEPPERAPAETRQSVTGRKADAQYEWKDLPPAPSLEQFKCSVCGLRTVGGPCQKHPKSSERVS